MPPKNRGGAQRGGEATVIAPVEEVYVPVVDQQELIFQYIKDCTLLDEIANGKIEVSLLPGNKTKDLFGHSPFLAAGHARYTDFIEYCLKNRIADVDEVVANTGNSCLMLSCIYGNQPGVELLISRKADLNLQNNNGWTAVFHATSNGHTDCVVALLIAQADIHFCKDTGGNLPLHYSCLFNNMDITRLLIQHQADPSCKNNDGLTPLDNSQEHEACKGYLQEIIVQNQDLILACRDGDLDRVKEIYQTQTGRLLIEKQSGTGPAPKNAASLDGGSYSMSPLEWAVLNKHFEVVQELISNGAWCEIESMENFLKIQVEDSDAQDLLIESLSWNSDLIAALKAESWTEAQGLLDKSACVMYKEAFTNRTPLHLACMGHREAPYTLINQMVYKKADFLARDVEGWTPLLHAVNNAHYTTTGLLLRECPKDLCKQILMPNFEKLSPILSALLQDDVILVRCLVDFVDLHKDVFPKLLMGEWSTIASKAGKTACMFLIFHSMQHMQTKLEVKSIVPYVLKAAVAALKRANESGTHFICGQSILRGISTPDIWENVDWDTVFRQAPDKYKTLLEFDMETVGKDRGKKDEKGAKGRGAKGKAAPKAKKAEGDTTAETVQPDLKNPDDGEGKEGGSSGSEKENKEGGGGDSDTAKKEPADFTRKQSEPNEVAKSDPPAGASGKPGPPGKPGAKKASQRKNSKDAIEKKMSPLDHFWTSMQKLRSHTIPTMMKLEAEYFTFPKGEISKLLMNEDINSEKAVILVLYAKGDPNFIDTFGRTPLFFHAAMPGLESIKIVKTLLYNNADSTITDNEGKKAIHVAVEPFSKKMLRSSQIEGLQLFMVRNRGLKAFELRTEGLPCNREVVFIEARLTDLLEKLEIEHESIKIPVGAIDAKPMGYAIIKLKLNKEKVAEILANMPPPFHQMLAKMSAIASPVKGLQGGTGSRLEIDNLEGQIDDENKKEEQKKDEETKKPEPKAKAGTRKTVGKGRKTQAKELAKKPSAAKAESQTTLATLEGGEGAGEADGGEDEGGEDDSRDESREPSKGAPTPKAKSGFRRQSSTVQQTMPTVSTLQGANTQPNIIKSVVSNKNIVNPEEYEQQYKDMYVLCHQAQRLLTGQVLWNEKSLTYRTRDKFFEDLVISEDMYIMSVQENGIAWEAGLKLKTSKKPNADQESQAPGSPSALSSPTSTSVPPPGPSSRGGSPTAKKGGLLTGAGGENKTSMWKLVSLNGTSYNKLIDLKLEVGKMKEKQKIYVHLQVPKPLGRIQCFIDQRFT